MACSFYLFLFSRTVAMQISRTPIKYVGQYRYEYRIRKLINAFQP